ncbi:MAG: glycosyltransferase [Actinomycetota bacterium]
MLADLSLVIPTFQEEQRLPRTLERLEQFTRESGISLHLIVSDDGSTDATTRVVTDWIARSMPAMTVELVQITHRGKGAAVREGMRYARAPIVGCFDADLSPGTDAVEVLYRAMQAGPDMVMASRAMPGSVIEVHPAWYRELAGRVFNLYLRKLSGVGFRDTQCGLKLWRREVAQEIFRHQRLDGFAFDAELVVLASRLGYRIEEIPVRWAHCEGSKLRMLRDAYRMSRDVLRTVRNLGKGAIHAPGIPHSSAMEVMNRSEDLHWWYVAKRQVVLSSLRRYGNGGRCLDIGCGGGAMLLEAATSTPAFGIDLSNQALDHAHARGLHLLVKAEASALPFAPGSFGSVLLLDVLEHHARPEQLLRQVREVLSPDGVVVITVPAFEWMWSYADHILGHYRRYTRSRLENELSASGFNLRRTSYFHSWLLPVAWSFRKLRTLFRMTGSADDFSLPAPLNWALLGASRIEGAILKRYDMPFGLSVLGIATPAPQPEAPAREVLIPEAASTQ